MPIYLQCGRGKVKSEQGKLELDRLLAQHASMRKLSSACGYARGSRFCWRPPCAPHRRSRTDRGRGATSNSNISSDRRGCECDSTRCANSHAHAIWSRAPHRCDRQRRPAQILGLRGSDLAAQLCPMLSLCRSRRAATTTRRHADSEKGLSSADRSQPQQTIDCTAHSRMASERSSLLHGGSGGSSGAPHTLPAGGPSYAAVASGSEPAPHNHAAHDADDMERGDHDHSAHGHSHGSNGGRGGHGHSHGGHSHSAQSLRALQSSTPPRMSPRTAFAHRDAEASKRAHAAKRAAKNGSPSSGSPKEEGHNTDTGEYIKSIVYGGLDGIITTFATVTSVAGAEFTAAVVVVLGISHLFADGLSMGLGDYMSSQAEIDYTASEREREQWEMDQNMSQGHTDPRECVRLAHSEFGR